MVWFHDEISYDGKWYKLSKYSSRQSFWGPKVTVTTQSTIRLNLCPDRLNTSKMCKEQHCKRVKWKVKLFDQFLYLLNSVQAPQSTVEYSNFPREFLLNCRVLTVCYAQKPESSCIYLKNVVETTLHLSSDFKIFAQFQKRKLLAAEAPCRCQPLRTITLTDRLMLDNNHSDWLRHLIHSILADLIFQCCSVDVGWIVHGCC